jgi:hypothetical protein
VRGRRGAALLPEVGRDPRLWSSGRGDAVGHIGEGTDNGGHDHSRNTVVAKATQHEELTAAAPPSAGTFSMPEKAKLRALAMVAA